MPGSRHRHVIRAGALLLGALALCGCSNRAPGRVSFHELRLARAFTLLPIYWDGPSLDGLALTAADDGYDYEPTIGMRVYYGTCSPRKSILDTSGCKIPLQITTVIYEPHSNAPLGPQRATTIRGAPAVIFDGGRAIELYSGHVTIDILADSPARALAAARHLTRLNGAPAMRLAPPQFAPGRPVDPRATAIANELRAPATAAPEIWPLR